MYAYVISVLAVFAEETPARCEWWVQVGVKSSRWWGNVDRVEEWSQRRGSEVCCCE